MQALGLVDHILRERADDIVDMDKAVRRVEAERHHQLPGAGHEVRHHCPKQGTHLRHAFCWRPMDAQSGRGATGVLNRQGAISGLSWARAWAGYGLCTNSILCDTPWVLHARGYHPLCTHSWSLSHS